MRPEDRPASAPASLPPVCEDVWTSADLHASAIVYDPGRPIVVTFSPAAPTRETFGGPLFKSRRINHLAVTCLSPDWWQTGAIDAAGAAIRDAVARFPRVVHYGSSMGAYGALFFSGIVEPDCVVAIAPQFSIAPNQAPNETRWAANVPRILQKGGFLEPAMAGRVMRGGRVFIVFDPLNPDAEHVRLFEAVRPIDRVIVPCGGHGLLFALAQMGLASTIATAAVEADPDPGALRAEIRGRRRRSIDYMHRLVERLVARGRPVRGALALALDALPPEEPALAVQIMNSALQAGHEDLAARAFLSFLDGAVFDGDVGLIARMRDRAPLLVAHGLVPAAHATLDRWIADAALPRQEDIAKINNTLRRYGPADPLNSQRVRSAVRLLKWSGSLDTVTLARIAKAILLRAEGDADGGRALLDEASVHLGGWHPFNLEVAKTWGQFGDDRKAVMFARRVAEREATPGAATQVLAIRLEAVGDHAAALVAYERLSEASPAGNPMWASSLIGRARCLRRFGDLEAAVGLLDQVLARAPQNALAVKLRDGITREIASAAQKRAAGSRAAPESADTAGKHG